LRATAAAVLVLAIALGDARLSARAAEDDGSAGMLSATATLASDYRFRGQSQTDSRGAFQGGLDYAHPSGVFAGLWASTINFNDEPNSPAEVDFTAGYSHAFSDTTEGSLAGAYYWYPDSEPADYDYFEIIGTISHALDTFTLSGELTYSADYSGRTGTGVGLTGGIEAPLPIGGADWLSASGHVGYQWIADNLAYGVPDWVFYDIGLTATWNMLAFDVRYTGTDIAKADCYGGANVCSAGMVFSLTLTVPFS
jgi:uncharacterized protein (TIGR02001 family)